MTHCPYDTNNPLKAFDEIDSDAALLERMAADIEGSSDAVEKIGNRGMARVHRLTAKRLRRMAAFLDFMKGRTERIHLLEDPVKRASTYGGGSLQREVAR